MATAVIQLPPDGAGKMVAARSYTESANTVYAQAGYLTTDTAGGNPAAVQNTVPAGTEYGLLTRSMMFGGGFAAQTGSLAAVTGSITATGLSTSGNITFTVSGTYSSSAPNIAYIFEASPDSGTTWAPVSALREDTGLSETTGQLASNTIRTWQFAMGGYDQFRFRVTTWAATATGTLNGRFTPGGMFFEPSSMSVPSRGSRSMLSLASTAAIAGVTSEALVSLVPTIAGVAGSTNTSTTVTTGKVMRIVSMVCTVRASAAVASWARFTLRTNPSGSTTATSPVLSVVEVGTPAQVIGSTATSFITFPESGLEFTGLEQIGVSHIASATTVLENIVLQGFLF